MALKKPHRQNRDLGNWGDWWGLLMDDVQLGGGGRGGNWGKEMSVNGEDGEKLLSKLSPTSS